MSRSYEDISFELGRGEIKVPTDRPYKDRRFGASALRRFFEDFWIINTPDQPYYDRFIDQGGNFIYARLKHGKELVIPSDESGPTLIVRSRFTPKETVVKEIRATVISNEQGSEKHEILTLPEQAGQFQPLVSCLNYDDIFCADIEEPQRFRTEYDFRRTIETETEGQRIEWQQIDEMTRDRYEQTVTHIVEYSAQLLRGEVGLPV